jgi:hypothetical protein
LCAVEGHKRRELAPAHHGSVRPAFDGEVAVLEELGQRLRRLDWSVPRELIRVGDELMNIVVGEFAGMEWSDIAFENRLITIERSFGRAGWSTCILGRSGWPWPRTRAGWIVATTPCRVVRATLRRSGGLGFRQLGEEREVIQALLATGRMAEVKQQAAAFVRRCPQSPFRPAPEQFFGGALSYFETETKRRCQLGGRGAYSAPAVKRASYNG